MAGAHDTERQFIRHPSDVPLQVTNVPRSARSRIADISHGGLAFVSAEPQRRGSELEIRIPDVDADFRARARVAWCRRTDDGYRIGVRFLDPDDAFRSRMIEQLCAIESYRREVLAREGRALSGEEAAREWIEQRAHRFPDPR